GAPRRDREGEDAQHLLQRRLRRIRLGRPGGGGGGGPRPPPPPGTPGGAAGGEPFPPQPKAPTSRARPPSARREDRGENQKKLAKASDKMFKDFPPGSKDKK